ncbi:MAG TPA: (Fe-S)-binding protein [Bacillota bacterium]
MNIAESWLPPGKDCGLCGNGSCREFLHSVQNQEKYYTECPFYQKETDDKTHGQAGEQMRQAKYTGKDILGHAYDFILSALPGEISPRKIVLPFRPDLVDILDIHKGDYIMGRPMGAGCPVPHVQYVIDADRITGVLTTWVVGPKISREHSVKDVKAYHMIGFEGLAEEIRNEPTVGYRMTFLPGCCMMNLNHTALVNMVLETSYGKHIHVEDIRILAGIDESKNR